MHSRLLVSGLPTSLPSLPRSPAPPCLPCVEGRLCATPHSSEFPPTTAPLQTPNMDVWGPAPVGGTDQKHYFLLVVDDYTRYTTVFPLQRKAYVSGVLIPWIRATHRQLRERFRRDFPVLRVHSNMGEISPTLRWTGKVGDASVFWVWGALSLVRDAKASKLSSRTLRCIFLGFPTNAPPWQFYHPRSRRVFSSQAVTFDKPPPGPAPLGVSPVDLPPLVEPLEISWDSSGPAEGGDPAADDTVATRRSPRLETPAGFPPCLYLPPPQPGAVDSGAQTAGAEPGGAKTEGEGFGGVDSGGVATRGADSGGAASPSGGGAVGDPAGGPRAEQPPQPDLLETFSPQVIRAWIVRQGSPGGGGYGPAGAGAASTRGTAGAGGTGGARGAGDTTAGGAAGTGVAAGARAASAKGAVGAGGAGTTPPLLAPAIPGTHDMTLRPSFVPQRVVLPSPPASSLPDIVDPLSDLACASSPTDRQEELECLAAAAPHLATMLLAPEGDPDALDIPTSRSYKEAISGTYVDKVPPLGANIVSGMWILWVKLQPGPPPAFKVRYVARRFSQRERVNFFQTFSTTPKMTTLRVLLHVAAQPDYELHSLDFSTAFLQGSLHEAIWLRRPSGFTGSFPEGTQWSLRRPVYGLRQAPRKWHDTMRTTLAALGFAPTTADPSLFLRTDTSLPPFYVLVYVDDLVFATADIEALALVKAELHERHTCTDLGELRSYLGLQITRDRARRTITLTQSHMVH
ncbi:unnamed protein product [Closterium sp. NIES-53]